MRAMKDSGIEWVGDIPSDWGVLPVKYVINITNGGDPKTDGDIPVYGSGSGSFRTCGEYKQGPAVLLGRKGTVNIPQFIAGKYWNVDTAFDAKVRHDYCLKFFYYNALCFDYDNYSTQTALPSMTQANYNNFRIIDIPIDLQENIVAFLDSKCAEIDSLRADIEKEIKTLEEYKKSVITEAVTKGLDKNVPMKDSGIEWVGQIPETWEEKPIRFLFDQITAKNKLGKEKTALKFTYGTIIPKTDFDADTDEYVADTILNYTIVKPGVIMINCLNLNYDFVSQRIGLVKNKGVITSAYLAIFPRQNVLPEYANYQLKYFDSVKAFHNMGTGVRKTLDFTELGKKYFVLPPVDVQKQIVSFLDRKCAEIDVSIKIKKDQLSTLDEYKKSVIYEYVTGKKEVPIA